MLKNYLDMMNIHVEDLKNYLYEIDDQYDESIEYCFLNKQVKEKVLLRKEYYFKLACLSLMKVKGFDNMERHIIMMNYFFEKKDLYPIYKVLKEMILTLHSPVQQYRLLRHMMHMNRVELIETLYSKHYINRQQAAYFFLVEEYPDKAYDYLSECTEVNDSLLNYYMMYSRRGYKSLKRQYKKREKSYNYQYN